MFFNATHLVFGENGTQPRSTEPGGKPKAVIPDPSLKGALRHQAARIFNTFQPENREAFLNFFGHVNTQWKHTPEPGILEKTPKPAVKGRLRVEERTIEHPLHKRQQRNKIDRFTGGTVPTALFDCIPLWQNAKSVVHVELEARIVHEWEAGLLLLVIKDLWLGLATIGGETGVGRGRFRGHEGTLTCNGATVTMTATDENPMKLELKEGDGDGSPEELLNRCVAAFRHFSFPSSSLGTSLPWKLQLPVFVA